MAETTDRQSVMVPEGSYVLLLVSSGARPESGRSVRVPDVTARTLAHAGMLLGQSGFVVRTLNEYSDRVKRSQVIGQLPAAGSEAAEGAEVLVLVSNGPSAHLRRAVLLPEVTGMHEQEAAAMLDSAGLRSQVMYTNDPSAPEGVVSAQLPDQDWLAPTRRAAAPWWKWAIAAGVLVLAAALVLALLGRWSLVAVPDVAGLTQAEAVATVTGAGLKPHVTTSRPATASEAAGTVSSQDPPPGSRVTRGAIVELKVVGVAESAAVPDVVGLKSEVARERLRSAGFGVRLTQRKSAVGRPGSVIQQDPVAGALVVPGSAVSLVVAAGGAAGTVPVPRLSGLTREEAESQLLAADLAVEIAENPNSDAAQGIVMMQYPSEGTEVEPGAVVGIIVSAGVPEDATTTQMADVVGGKLSDAEAQAETAGLISRPVAVSGSDAKADEVIAQLPPAGATLSPGSTVLFFYASGF